MTTHLSNEQIAAAVAGIELDIDGERHLDGCVACRGRVDEMRRLVSVRREQLRGDEPDWEAQRDAILDRLGAGPRRRVWRRWLAAAAAVIAAAGIGITVHREIGTPSRPEVSVEQILADVDQTLGSETIPGFEALEPLVPAPGDLESLNENGTS